MNPIDGPMAFVHAAAVKYHPSNKPLTLKNLTCIYCGTSIRDKIKRTKEHVIARKFVPRGSLDNCWNLIARACKRCNGEKSEVEEQIAAVTMQPNAAGRYAISDAFLQKESRRKARGSKSRRTGKLIARSKETMKFKAELLRGVNLTFNFTGPPQLDEEQVWQLALYHVRAFFYMITYDRVSRTGRFWKGGFGPVGVAHRGDWGNIQLLGFQELVKRWPCRVHAIGADEYFKIVIRRAHDDPPVWAWALEWNHNYRVFGFCGGESRIKDLFGMIPPLKWHSLQNSAEGTIRLREDCALSTEDDHLFEIDSANAFL